jgi:chemotaxis-related protein WspB
MRVLTFQVGSDRMALPLTGVVAVVPRVPLRRLAGGPDWLAGLLSHRGGAVPVIDLARLTGAGECPDALGSRIILVPRPGGAAGELLGLLAAEVADVREVPDGAARLPGFDAPGRPDFGPLLMEGNDVLRLLDVGGLPSAGGGGP